MIPGRLLRLLEPQERFDALQSRFGRLGSRIADLSYANFDGPLDAGVRDVLQKALATDRDRAFQYTPYGGSRTARRAVADALSASHGAAFAWQDVVLTNGAAAALAIALRALGQPGDEVVVPVPCWFDHPLYVEACGKTAVLVPLSDRDDFGLDVDALGAAVTRRTTALIVSNPANPTGRSYDDGTITRLGAMLSAAQRQLGTAITLVTDETHRDLAGASFAACSARYDRTLVVYSFGKYHLLQGQRLGYVAVAPAHPDRSLAADLVRWARIAGNTTPTSLMQLAVPGLLALRHDVAALDDWRGRYVSRLRSAGYRVVQPDGTHFVYVRTPAGLADEAWVETLVREHKVLAVPSSLFHHTGYFRLSLTATPERLAAALAALEEAGTRWCRTSP